MPPNGYCGPILKNDINHPITLVALLIILTLGGWMVIQTWF